MIVDDRLNFKEHVKFIGEKVSVTQGALTRMVINIGGSIPFQRRMILWFITSIILYGRMYYPWGDDKEENTPGVSPKRN